MLHFNTDKHNITTVIAKNNKQYNQYRQSSKPITVAKEYTDYKTDTSTLTTASKPEIILNLINKFNFIPNMDKLNIDRIKFISFKINKISKTVKGFKSSCKTISVKIIYNDRTSEFLNYKK